MVATLRIGLWNANGLNNHREELKSFIINQNLDVMLISETHFTSLHYFRMRDFTTYTANVTDGRAHGGAAIIIKSTIKHHEEPKYETEKIQAATVNVIDWLGPLSLSAAYCPPRHRINRDDFASYFSKLRPRFISGGDFNAKHTQWGARLTTPRGRVLHTTINEKHLSFLSSNEPTYWPADMGRLPDLLDFFVTQGINERYAHVESCSDLSSDHSPVILTLSSALFLKPLPLTLHNKQTDWETFREILQDRISFDFPLTNERDIDEAVQLLTTNIQQSAWASTPRITNRKLPPQIPQFIRRAIIDKRRLRRIWQNTRRAIDKQRFNNAARNLKHLLHQFKDESVGHYLENLTPFENTNYSLWKLTAKIKTQHTSVPPLKKGDGTWARSDQEKSDTMASHLADVFRPFPTVNPLQDKTIYEFLEAPYQMALPLTPLRPQEIKNIIKQLKKNKSPGYDLITGKVLQELPQEAIRLLAIIFNGVLRIGYFPDMWKVAEIIVIGKPGKPPTEVSSYRPISLLPILSKVLEKTIFKRLMPVIESREIIPSHQFGFRSGHNTIEQVHRIVNNINTALEEKKFCSVAFLDIRQAFDKVWHNGLLYKLKGYLPMSLYIIIKSFLASRKFMVKFHSSYSKLHPIEAGVPQGSVLAPVLYSLYTADLPLSDGKVSTFADDTAIQEIDEDAVGVSRKLQEDLDTLQNWQTKWRMKTNECKSQHVSFTLRHETPPPVYLGVNQLPQSDSVKYLGMHLDRRLTWKAHIMTKRKQLNLLLRRYYWVLGPHSRMSLNNKVLIYKCIIKPIWSYGIQLWGTASNSNIDILERFQSKILRVITNAPWYVTNNIIRRDLYLPTVKEVILNSSTRYQQKLESHENHLAINLLDNSDTTRRLKRKHPTDLYTT